MGSVFREFLLTNVQFKTDADGPGWTDELIADTFDCRRQTVERLRQRCVTESFERALHGKKRKDPPTPPQHGWCR